MQHLHLSHMTGLTHIDAAAVFSVPASTLGRVSIFKGRQDVLARADELEALAVRSGQPGAMHGLAFLLDDRYASRKVPHLVCLYEEGALMGAALFFEYGVAGWPIGMMATGDRFGVRTVIGEEGRRPRIAETACSSLLERGATTVLASFKYCPPLHTAGGSPTSGASRGWAIQTRVVRDTLPLARTVDETLARMGKRTRTHLRYYQRRLEKMVPCEFLPDVSPWIRAEDRQALSEVNRRSLDPMPQAAFDLQFRAAMGLTGGFVSGLRSKSGEWLALAGGWRQGQTTWIQWQNNAAGYEDLSIATAFRAFLIEEEVRLGGRQLAFHGGTSHSMSHAFLAHQVVDMVATRPALASGGVARLTPGLYRMLPRLRSRGNFLGDALSGEDIRWWASDDLAAVFARSPEPPTVIG